MFLSERNLESYPAVMMLHDGVGVRLVARSAPIGFQIAAPPPKLGAHWLHGTAGHFYTLRFARASIRIYTESYDQLMSS